MLSSDVFPRNLTLDLWDCRGWRSDLDVIELTRTVAAAGLLPADGAWTTTSHPEPVRDLEAFVKTRRQQEGGSGSPSKRLQPRESWTFPVINPAAPEAFSTLLIQLLTPDVWTVFLAVSTHSHRWTGLSLEQFCEGFGLLFTNVGSALYPHARPSLAAITTSHNDYENRDHEDYPDFRRAWRSRRLIVGWRT